MKIPERNKPILREALKLYDVTICAEMKSEMAVASAMLKVLLKDWYFNNIEIEIDAELYYNEISNFDITSPVKKHQEFYLMLDSWLDD